MKINEIITEGFWDSLAKSAEENSGYLAGLGGEVGRHYGGMTQQRLATQHAERMDATKKAEDEAEATTVPANATQNAERMDAIKKAEDEAEATTVPANATPPIAPDWELEPTELVKVAPGQRLDITVPTGSESYPSRYYKTDKGWFNTDTNYQVTQAASIDKLEQVADGQAPAAKPRQMSTTTATTPSRSIAPLSKAEKQELEKQLNKPQKPVSYKPEQTIQQQPTDESTTNPKFDIYSGFNEWKQEIAGMSAGFAKYKRNNDGEIIARYNGKVIGKWNDWDGEGHVFNNVDTVTPPIVKEMAERRLKREIVDEGLNVPMDWKNAVKKKFGDKFVLNFEKESDGIIRALGKSKSRKNPEDVNVWKHLGKFAQGVGSISPFAIDIPNIFKREG